MKRRSSVLIAVIFAMLVIALLVRKMRNDAAPAYISFTQRIMSTQISVTVPEESGAEAAKIVFDVFQSIDARISEWKETSALSLVNEAAGVRPVAVPDDLRAIIKRGIGIGELTDGAFDITWAALRGLWDFNTEQPYVPADDEIDRRIALIDYRRVEIDDEAGTVFLPEKGMKLGLGGIAKGYALERAASALRAKGIDSFLIAAGGQMMVAGTRGDRPWRIGVRDPRKGPDEFFAFIEVSNTSVSTSGDYERYFIIDGVRHHHILDPRTGRPARSGLRSATVICPDATLADALSTALIILGRESAMSLVESLDGVEAVLVDDEAHVHVSSGLEGRLRESRPPAP